MPLALTITGAAGGFALRFGSEVVATYPTWAAAQEAYRFAIQAQFMLSALLTRTVTP